MHWNLLAHAAVPVQIHVGTVVPAFVIGTWLILVSAKGKRAHRAWGYAYMALMTGTALSSAFIHDINPGGFSLVHLFIPATLIGVAAGLQSARSGDVAGHKLAMIGLYFGGILIAGALTFAPGRLMHRIFFG